MVKDLNGHYGLILGGSSGLGYATAYKCAAHGMRLIIVYRASRLQEAELKNRFAQLEQHEEHLYINADATNKLKINTIVDQIKGFLNGKKLYLLLHSISKGNVKPMKGENSLNTGDFEQTIYSMGINLYQWAQTLIQNQLFAQPARIISFTSEGNTRHIPGYAAVSAAKSTLESITKSMAIELAAHYITSNCIQAGVTDTDSLRRIPNVDKIMQTSLDRNPFDRLTTPQDVAGAVYLLCRPEANFINGSIIKVDGGESLS